MRETESGQGRKIENTRQLGRDERSKEGERSSKYRERSIEKNSRGCEKRDTSIGGQIEIKQNEDYMRRG